MPLLPPVVVGPISECSSSVRVQGQLVGATVDIFSNGVHVGTGVATWTDQVFPLNGGVTLAPGANITAKQTSGGQTSPASPIPVVVQKKPPVIGPVGLRTHLYECGQCVFLDGMVPGAKVEITVGGVVRGTGKADDGTARFGLSPQTSLGDQLVAQQTACGTPGAKTNLPLPDPIPGGKRHLPPPTLNGPLKACQTAVLVSNVTDGAQVVMTETPGFTEQACFDLPALWFQCPPLTQGSKVSAIQKMPKCEVTSASSPAVPVGPPTPVPSPVVVPPLCAGGVIVRLTNLLPGSIIEIFQNGISLGQGSSPAATFDFETPALTGGDVITATQELCTHVSSPSNGVTVNPAPGSLPTPVVRSPLFQCGAAVHVSNLHPGVTVFVWSTLLGAPIGIQDVYTTQADVPVAPLLIKGDHIFATQQGCGLVSSKSAAVPVHPLGKVLPPTVERPVEACMRSVTVAGVIPGAHVDVYVNNVWRGSAIATAPTVEVPLTGSLRVGDSIKARQSICGIITAFGPAIEVISSAGFYYLTQHFNNARTGWYPYETTLNVANVPNLKKLFSQDLSKFVDPDGHTHTLNGTCYAQPLYAHHVNIPGSGAHNVVYVATEDDTVFAFDADTPQAPLWQRSLIPAGEQFVVVGDIGGCDNVSPNIGITGTPVIDCASYTMWVVAKTKRVQGGNTTFHLRLYALDIATGLDRPGSPVEIQATYPGKGSPNDGKGNVVFVPQWHMNRPGLLLLNGRVYIGFGSHCDASASQYHGWILAYDATTLQQVGVFCTTPDSDPQGDDMGAVWQGGMGVAADPEGFIYFLTGNGEFDANTGGQNYADTALKLPANLAVPPPTIPADYFTPANQGTLLQAQDVDFGSGGPLILPDSPTGLPQTMVAAGKDGQIFLINRQNMGKYNGPGGPDKVLAVVQMQPGKAPDTQPGVWGGPAYFHTGEQQFVYYAGAGGPLTAFAVAGASLALAKVGANPNQTAVTFPVGGTTPIVSSNQQTAGTGVVWALDRNNPMNLLAWDATDLTKPPLFNQVAGKWNSGGGAFIAPTAIRGKVYVATDGILNVFGL